MLAFVLILIAIILFILAGVGVASGRYNLIAIGLAFFAGAFLVQVYPG
jgi:hypothetical protein